MQLYLQDLQDKSPKIWADLPMGIKGLSEKNFLVFFYWYDNSTSKITDIKNVAVVSKISFQLYKDMPFAKNGMAYSLGYFQLPLDTQSMLFYQFVSFYCMDKVAVKDFYDEVRQSDLHTIQRKKLSTQYHNVFNIFTRDIFKESVDRFIMAEEVKAPIMTIFDSFDSYLKQNKNQSLYGETISKVVMAIRNPNGGLIPEKSGKLRYLYVGEKAVEVSSDGTLAEAKEMLRNKFSPGEIYAKTSWFFNKFDNKWRKQISDADTEIAVLSGKKMFMKSGSKFADKYDEIEGYIAGGPATSGNLIELIQSGWDTYLSDILKHPTLYKNYPQLFKLPVFYATNNLGLKQNDSYQFYHNPKDNFLMIYGNPLIWDLKTVLLHETQHAIQGIEGFATGGNDFIAKMIQAVGGSNIKAFFYLRKQIEELYKNGAVPYGDYSYEKYSVLVDKINEFIGKHTVDIPSEQEYYRTYSEISQAILSIYTNAVHMQREAKKKIPIVDLIGSFLKSKITDASEKIDKMCESASIQSHRMMAQGLTERQVNKVFFETYEALAGEIEARDTEHTSRMEESLKGYLLPMTSEAVDSEKVTVIIDDFISDEEPAQAKIKAGVEKGEDGKYVIHLLETMSSEPILHELGHIVGDMIGMDIIVERISKAFSQDTIDEFGGVGEIFCEQFLSYIAEQNISEALNYDLSFRSIEDKKLFEDEFKAIFYIKSDQEQEQKLMDMLKYMTKLNEVVYDSGLDVSPLVKYEEDVLAFIEELGEMDRSSDAQGVAEQYAEFVKASLIAGSSARKTALKILEKTEPLRILNKIKKINEEIATGTKELADMLGDTFSGMPELDESPKSEIVEESEETEEESEIEEKIDLTTKEGILKSSTIEGNVVKLPPGNLDRKLYVEVKKALELIGGKWVGGKTMGFVFNEDPTELLAQVSGGEKRNLKKEFQFFATPDSLSDEVVQLANIGKKDKVLEPSAGQGAIVNAVHRINPDIVVDYCEFMPTNQIFMKRLPNVNMVGDDFLALPLSFQYDKIVANPPFAKNQDVVHVQKMYEHLKPGGRLVAITSPHWKHSTNKKETQFRDWLNKVGATIKEIPAGTFKESGTSVATVILVIDKKEKMARGGKAYDDKWNSDLLKMLGYTKKDIAQMEKFNKFRDKFFGDIIKIKDIPNIKSGDKLCYTYRDTTYEKFVDGTSYGMDEVGISGTEWGLDAHPFDMESEEIIENKNNPEFELKNIQNEEYVWTLYKVKVK